MRTESHTNKMLNIIIQSVLCLVFTEQLHASNILKSLTDKNSYKLNKTMLLADEFSHSLGGHLELTPEENQVNEILMKLKAKEIDESVHGQLEFKFSRHYFTYRDQIENSELYQIIKRMPKGAALHVHSTFMLGADYWLNVTYEDHLYVCYTDDDLKLQFSDTIPERPCPVKWALLSELRAASDDVEAFDFNLKKHFTLYSEDPKDIESDANTVWQKFDKIYYAIKSLITYRPVRERYIYDSLKKFYDDNIIYMELRSGLHTLYELNGTTHDGMYMAELYQQITRNFIEDYPDFLGVKLILTRHRAVNETEVKVALDKARRLKNEIPEIFAGFDLVGQEDKGQPLIQFIDALNEAKGEMNFYFHGGETNWSGTSSDENLIDAILLGSKRIGHAYSLTKHPTLMAIIKQRGIALEVNVISNAVLSLVRDVRNHPLATYLAFNLPVVLSSDDPGVWGAEPLSHDFYVAFVAVASKHADIRMLKWLATNSLKYSAMTDAERSTAKLIFDRKWEKFLKEVISMNGD